MTKNSAALAPRSRLSALSLSVAATLRATAQALVVAALCLAGAAEADARSRIKDLVEFDGVRGNQLLGYGLVVGLDGSGDSLTSSPFTEQALISILDKLGINVSNDQLRSRNVAAVLVTAQLPPFARAGSRVDVNVSTIGDAKSLVGGTLVITPLAGVDGEIYAVAQGSVLAGGVTAQGQNQTVTTGVPTAGSVPRGAQVEREVKFKFGAQETLRLALRDADFTTAERIERAINRTFGRPIAVMLDSGTVQVKSGPAIARSPAHLISRLENIRVQPDIRARVVVDQRSGTIVLGNDVRISPVAVAQGNLTIKITETPTVSQPSPFSETGDTVVVPQTDIDVNANKDKRVAMLPANTTLSDLVDGLNALGVGPRDMIDILKTIKSAGALHAELVIQ